jgi:hypothetical protein
MSNDGRAYNWDDEIQNDGEAYVLLEPGEYPFTVKMFERARHEGSDKLPPCNKAVVHIEIDGGALGTATVKHNLFLHSSCEWRLCAFFLAIGMRKHGEPLRMNWNQVAGRRGRCKVKHRQYDGKTFNEIDRFLEPSEPSNGTQAPPAEAWADQF